MMDERKFDTMLEDAMTELPPNYDQSAEITPWRTAMKRVIWGIGLTTLTLQAYWLQYILPAQGVILSVLGYRTLRKENRYFRWCWLLSLYGAAAKFVSLVLNATLIRLPAMNLVVLVSIVLGYAETICLWKGIRAVRVKAGQADEAGAVIALLVWEGVVVALVLLGLGGWLLLLPMLICYICILRALSRIPALLDDAGYEIEPASVRVPDMAVKVGWNCGLIVCVLTAVVLCCRYPMEWSSLDKEEHAGLEQMKTELVELGLPQQVADDLAPEDLALLEGADFVEVRKNWEDFTNLKTDSGDALLYDIAVRMADGRWMAIHHFQWVENPTLRTTECMLLWPAYRHSEGYRQVREITGRILFDREGETFTGDYYTLSDQTYTTQSFLDMSRETRTNPIATFSLPLRGENCRGYLCYVVEVVSEGWIFDSWNNYTHQTDIWVYPMMSAEEYEKSGIWNGQGGFYTTQNAVQFFPNETGKNKD